MGKINSPEQLNKYMKASKAKIWIVLAFMLLSVLLVLYWLVFVDITVTEEHPCYISAEKTTIAKFVDEVFHAEFSDDDMKRLGLDEAIASYGEDHLSSEIYPAVIYIKNIDKSNMLEKIPIEAAGHTGRTLRFPTKSIDCGSIVKGSELSRKEMVEAGMDPDTAYYTAFAMFVAEADKEMVSGIYNATVTIEVMDPMRILLY